MKRNEILGMPVMDLRSSRIRGRVTDLLLGGKELRVTALILRQGTAVKRSLPLGHILCAQGTLILYQGTLERPCGQTALQDRLLRDAEGGFAGRIVDLEFDLPGGRLRSLIWQPSLFAPVEQTALEGAVQLGCHTGGDLILQHSPNE